MRICAKAILAIFLSAGSVLVSPLQAVGAPDAGVSPRAPSDPTFTYAFAATGAFASTSIGAARGLFRNPMNDPTNVTGIAAMPDGANDQDLLVGIDNLANGDLVGVTADNRLVSVNSVTGIRTTRATITGLVGTLFAFAVNPATDEMFVSTSDLSGTSIYRLNASTGSTTRIGSAATIQGNVMDLAINCAGELYGVSLQGDVIGRIDTTTGVATLIGGLGALGFDVANFAGNGMDFDNTDGRLYAFFSASAGGPITATRYGEINLTTGAIGGVDVGVAIGAIVSPTRCVDPSLIFANGFE
jgi:hypothetical protein